MNLTEAQKLAEELMKKHILTSGFWSFKYFSSTRTLGRCKCVGAGGEIQLNKDFVLNAEIDDVRLTILHEIAHAMAGYEHGHDRIWALTCQSIGGKPERVVDSEVMSMVQAQNAKYVAICPSCGEKYYINRLGCRAKEGRKHCGHCSNRYGFSDKSRLHWHINY